MEVEYESFLFPMDRDGGGSHEVREEDCHHHAHPRPSRRSRRYGTGLRWEPGEREQPRLPIISISALMILAFLVAFGIVGDFPFWFQVVLL